MTGAREPAAAVVKCSDALVSAVSWLWLKLLGREAVMSPASTKWSLCYVVLLAAPGGQGLHSKAFLHMMA